MLSVHLDVDDDVASSFSTAFFGKNQEGSENYSLVMIICNAY